MLLTKDKGFYKNLLTLSIPIALQNLITFAVGFFDNIMVSSLGDSAVSGVYMGNQIQTLLQIFSTGAEGAILVLSAQYWGKRDTEAIKKITALGIKLSVSVGLSLSVICAVFPKWVISLFTPDSAIIEVGGEYLSVLACSFAFFCLTQSLIASQRATETPRLGLYVSLISLAVNIFLNYILIFGRLGISALGVKGAAIATLSARISEAFLVCIYVFFRDKKLKLKFIDIIKHDKKIFGDFRKYGSPILLGQLVWAVNTLSASAIMGRLTAQGAVAGLSIANTVGSLAYVLMSGMSCAVGIITGKTIGEGREEKMRDYALTVQLIFLALGIVSGLCVFALKDPFISLYGVSTAAADQARAFINVLSVTSVGTSYQAAVLFGLVKSGGDTSFVMKTDALTVFFIVIPSALIAVRLELAPFIVFACLKSDQILKCLVAAIKVNRFDWIKNLTTPSHTSIKRKPKTAE